MDDLLSVTALPALKDNYIWIVCDHHSKQCVVIDPGEASPVLAYLQQQQIKLDAIIITHYHADHIGGIPALQLTFPEVRIYSSTKESLPYKTRLVQEGDKLSALDNKFACTVYEVPGHTLGHIVFYAPNLNGTSAIFTGDTLFNAGCGRLFEGTFDALYQSLLKLRALPGATQVYCGHEYTQTNLAFALWLEPDNLQIQSALSDINAAASRKLPRLLSTLSRECAINPFLRCDEAYFRKLMQVRLQLDSLPIPIELFMRLRKLRDNWSG